MARLEARAYMSLMGFRLESTWNLKETRLLGRSGYVFFHTLFDGAYIPKVGDFQTQSKAGG